jgi:hypothetical protein
LVFCLKERERERQVAAKRATPTHEAVQWHTAACVLWWLVPAPGLGGRPGRAALRGGWALSGRCLGGPRPLLARLCTRAFPGKRGVHRKEWPKKAKEVSKT